MLLAHGRWLNPPHRYIRILTECLLKACLKHVLTIITWYHLNKYIYAQLTWSRKLSGCIREHIMRFLSEYDPRTSAVAKSPRPRPRAPSLKYGMLWSRGGMVTGRGKLMGWEKSLSSFQFVKQCQWKYTNVLVEHTVSIFMVED